MSQSAIYGIVRGAKNFGGGTVNSGGAREMTG